jgi:hypothetical protein
MLKDFSDVPLVGKILLNEAAKNTPCAMGFVFLFSFTFLQILDML